MSTAEITEGAAPNGTGSHPQVTVIDSPVRSKASWLEGPGDLETLELDVPGLNDGVMIRSLTAGQHAEIQNRSMSMKGDEMRFDTHQRQVLTFMHGVIEPGDWDENEVNAIAFKWGAAFKFVVDAITEISDTDPEAMKKVRARFRPRR